MRIHLGYYIQCTYKGDMTDKSICAYLHTLYPNKKQANKALKNYRPSRLYSYAVVPVWFRV